MLSARKSLALTEKRRLPATCRGRGHFQSLVITAKLNNRGFKEVVNLGPAATNASSINAVFSKESGRDVVYSTTNGGNFNVVDIKDNKLLFSAHMSGVTQVWSHAVAPDGTVYIAALALNNVGELWSYSPVTKTVKKHGVPDTAEQAWSCTVDTYGNVYIGTFPTGKIIKYIVSTAQFLDLGQIDTKCGYVRSLQYHNGYIYAGLGVVGKIYRINIQTYEKKDITKNVPELIGKDVEGIKFCYDLAVVNNYLFARFDHGNEEALLFYDLKNQVWLNKKLAKLHDSSDDDFGAFGFNSQIPVTDNKAYVVYRRQLEEINLTTFNTRATGIKYESAWRGGAFVQFESSDSPGSWLVTLTRNGSVFAANIENKTVCMFPCVMQQVPILLHNLAEGPDGNVYMTTYPGGPKGARFNPKTGEFNSYLQDQAEGMAAGNSSDMYFGIYPGAVIQKLNTGTMKFENLFNLKDTYEQDRPYIMKFVDNKLLIGTIPDYQKLGGTLTIYDTLSMEQKIYRNVVQHQSIVGIAYKDGKIYGSTSIRGGLDIVPKAEKAKIFVWDVATESKVIEIELELPDLDKPTMISALTFDKDGLLWGAVDGIIFAMDLETYSLIKSKNIYPDIKNRGMWKPDHILWGEDGLLYTDIGGKLTVLDPINLNHVTLIGSGAEINFITLAKDKYENQNIYFLEEATTELKMIPVIAC